MKNILVLCSLLFISIACKSQKVYDPCQKLDTNTIKRHMIGTWVDMKDTTHTIVITEDSLTESIPIIEAGHKRINTSYWSYKFTDNMFSSEDVTCYSLIEYKVGYAHHSDYAINAIDNNYFLLGANGKMGYKRKK